MLHLSTRRFCSDSRDQLSCVSFFITTTDFCELTSLGGSLVFDVPTSTSGERLKTFTSIPKRCASAKLSHCIPLGGLSAMYRIAGGEPIFEGRNKPQFCLAETVSSYSSR